MKTRRHHNNKGYRQIRSGRTRREADRWNKEYGLKPRHPAYMPFPTRPL